MEVPINGVILLFRDLFEIFSTLHSHIFKALFLSFFFFNQTLTYKWIARSFKNLILNQTWTFSIPATALGVNGETAIPWRRAELEMGTHSPGWGMLWAISENSLAATSECKQDFWENT